MLRKGLWMTLVLGFAVGPGVVHAQEGDTQEETSQQASADSSEDAASGGDAADEASSFAYRLEEGAIVVRSGGEPVTTLEPPCRARDLRRSGEELYVACGEEGLYRYGLADPSAPEGVGFQDLGGSVDVLFEARDRVWAEIVRTEARPVGEGETRRVDERPVRAGSDGGGERGGESASAKTSTEGAQESDSPEASAQAETSESATRRPEGKVVEVRSGAAVVDIGSADGLERGDTVEIFRREAVELSDDQADREVTEVVGEVGAVAEDRAVVDLGLNEEVDLDRFARPTDRGVTADNMAPPRPRGQTAFEFMARPLLALGKLGGGIVGSASLRHSFEWPGTAELRLDPMSFASSSEQTVVPGAISGSFSYDTTVFRLGLGTGVYKLADRTFGLGEPTRQDAAFDLRQVVRLGARDGLNLQVRNSFIVVDAVFQYGGTTGEFQVSMSRFLDNTWMIFRGGTHSAGQGLGEVGLRVLTAGNGTEGSTILTVTIGAAGVWGDRKTSDCGSVERTEMCLESESYFGPVAGFGLERRF